MAEPTVHMLAREKVFRDPVHDYIHVQHQVILDLINTKEFQRLRRIKQLGTSSFTFHGAEHSRFSHSLGVYEIARRICDKFVRHHHTLWDDRERLVVLCAALLHDIGHGPFSHTFEKVFGTDHEQLTVAIITSSDTEVNRVLRGVSADFPEQVASVIRKTYPNPQVVQLISSQIDADRMDYLLRDAYCAGVSYGNFDLTRILRVIRPGERGICFDISGMHAVEDYIVCRYQMYMQVYFHPVSRGIEVLIGHLFKRALWCYQEGLLRAPQAVALLVPFFTGTWTLSDYLKLDDGVMTTYFTQWLAESDEILCDLAHRYLSRKPLKSVVCDGTRDAAAVAALTEYVVAQGWPADYYTGLNNSFDLPYDFYRPNAAKPRTQIDLVHKNNNIVELSQLSPLVAALTGQMKGDERFYFPKELYQDEAFVQLLEPFNK